MVSKYHPYDKYKPFEGKWLSSLPSHWREVPIKYLCTFYGGGTPSKDNQSFWQGDIPWVSPKDMKNQYLYDTEDHITESAVENSSTQMIDQGSLLIVVRSGILQHTIPVSINKCSVSLNQDMKALTFNDRTLPEFVKYYIKGNQADLLLDWRKQGATVESIEHEYLANSLLPLPPIDEQASITAFLDNETAKIDTLIEKQQQLIKLLNEKRQAVISHAVTKGLNPDAPMKDSGVEWLGEVPEHWAVAKLGFRYQIQLGKMLDDKKVSGNYLESYLRNTDVQWEGINTSELPQMDFKPDERERYSVQKGDLLVCEGGEIGRCAIWESDERCFYQKALHRLRPFSLESDSNRYMWYVLNDAVYRERFISGAGKSTIAHLPAEAFRQYRFPFPPLEEQTAIVDHLNTLKYKFDEMTDKAGQQILLLKERRTALISAAVTGKIDVRNFKADKSDAA